MIYFISSILLLSITIIFLAFSMISYSNSKLVVKNIKNTIPIILLLILFIIFTYNYMYNTPLNGIHKASYSYAVCMSNRLLKNDCDIASSILEAKKAEAELNGEKTNLIAAAEKLGLYEEIAKYPAQSPYDLIRNSLNKYPYFVDPTEDNYIMYRNCDLIQKPLYWIIAWNMRSNKNYIAVYKITDCPHLSDTQAYKDFPVITQNQYENLKEGNYWDTTKYGYNVPKIIEVKSPIISESELDKLNSEFEKSDNTKP